MTTWHELEPGVWIDSEQRWTIMRMQLVGFNEWYRRMDIRTHEMVGHGQTLAEAQEVDCE